MCRVSFLFVSAMAALAAVGCSASKASPASPDSGSDSGGSEVDSASGVDSGSEVDAGGPAPDAGAMTCDASALPVGVDAGAVAACLSCEVMNCAATLATCATDCTCGPDEQCLEMYNQGFTHCPDAINATMGGNEAIMAVTDCLATHCSPVCFQSADAGSDE